jgi:hypothetical protein
MSNYPQQPPVPFGDKYYFVVEERMDGISVGKFTDLNGNAVPIPKKVVCYTIIGNDKRPVDVDDDLWWLPHAYDTEHPHQYHIYIEGDEEQGPVLTITPGLKFSYNAPNFAEGTKEGAA